MPSRQILMPVNKIRFFRSPPKKSSVTKIARPQKPKKSILPDLKNDFLGLSLVRSLRNPLFFAIGSGFLLPRPEFQEPPFFCYWEWISPPSTRISPSEVVIVSPNQSSGQDFAVRGSLRPLKSRPGGPGPNLRKFGKLNYFLHRHGAAGPPASAACPTPLPPNDLKKSKRFAPHLPTSQSGPEPKKIEKLQ